MADEEGVNQLEIDQALQVLQEADQARLAAAGQDGVAPVPQAIMDQMQGRGLTDAQFAEFMRAVEERATRERIEQNAVKTRRVELDGQRTYDNNINEELKAQTKRIRPCDGTNPAAVREFLGEVELARPYLNNDQVALSKLCGRLLQGSLKKSYERFMSSQLNRDAVAWDAIKAHLRAAFLSADEGEHLKTALEKVTQTQYEANTAFTRRFLEAADDAYPEEDRTAGDERVLLNLYVKGLRNAKVVERLVQEARPDTLQEAVQGVERYTADQERFTRFGWASGKATSAVEPMEVDAIHKVSSDPQAGTGDAGFTVDTFIKSLGIETLTKQLKGVQSELGKLKAMLAAQDKPTTVSTGSNPPNKSQPQGSRRETRVCYKCRVEGHLARNCPSKKKGQGNQ